MFKGIVAGLAAVFAMSVAARADDLKDRGGSLKDAPMARGPEHSWAGLYVGGSVGYGGGDVNEIHTNRMMSPVALEIFTGESSSELSGGLYAGHIGYNLQFGHIVAGLEAGINATDFEDCDGCDSYIGVKTTMDWYATAVAKLGYAEGSWLFYGFGGLAWADAKEQMKDNLPSYYHGGDIRPPLGGGGSSNLHGGETSHVGWTAGLGVEYALNDSLSMRVEYAHVDLGADTVELGSFSDTLYTQTLSREIEFEFDTVKVGVSYRPFGEARPIDTGK